MTVASIYYYLHNVGQSGRERWVNPSSFRYIFMNFYDECMKTLNMAYIHYMINSFFKWKKQINRIEVLQIFNSSPYLTRIKIYGKNTEVWRLYGWLVFSFYLVWLDFLVPLKRFYCTTSPHKMKGRMKTKTWLRGTLLDLKPDAASAFPDFKLFRSLERKI